MGSKPFIFKVAGVACASGLENKHLALFFGGAAVFDALGDHQSISGTKMYYLVAKFNSHFSSPDQKQLVLALVQVPGKLSLQLDQLQFLFVQTCYDLRFPVIREE